MKIAAAYIRVSTEMQTEYSPDAQINALQEYAARNNMVLDKEYIFADEGISGKTAEKRPAFMKMIAMAKQKPCPFDIILVHRFDRFARNREDSVVYKSLLRKECGIQVVSITEQLEDDKFSIILEAMLEAMAEYYSLNLADEVMKGMKEKAHRGENMSKPPYGYAIGQPPTVIPEEAAIVKVMYEKIHSGEMLPFTLARYLNNRNIYTRKGATWGVFTIKYILSNPFYTGELVWNRQKRSTMKFKDESEWIKAQGRHEPIIDKNTFNEVQKILAKHKHTRTRPASEYCHWLSGLVKCSNCGKTLSLSTQGNYPFFQCHNYNKGKCNKSHYIPVKTLEKSVVSAMGELIHRFPVNIQFEKRQSLQEITQTDFLEISLKKANERLIRVKNAYNSGVDTLEEYRDNKAAVLDEINRLEAELRRNTTKTTYMVEDIEKTKKDISHSLDVIKSDDVSIEEKNKMLRSFISKIVFHKDTKTIEVFYFYD